MPTDQELRSPEQTRMKFNELKRRYLGQPDQLAALERIRYNGEALWVLHECGSTPVMFMRAHDAAALR